MRAEEIREMTSDDITARIRELEEEQFRLRFRSATEPLEDPLRLRVIRRDVARLKTVLREKQTQAPTPPSTKTKTPRSAKKAGAAR